MILKILVLFFDDLYNQGKTKQNSFSCRQETQMESHPFVLLPTTEFWFVVFRIITNFPFALFFFFYIYFFNLFLAALGLSCHAQAFSSCGKRGLLFVAVQGLLIAVASLVAEYRF